MQIKKLADISYEMLAKRYKNISKSTFKSSDGKIDIVQVNLTGEKSSRLTSDLYVFKNDKLIARDVTLKTKDGGVKKIETEVYDNGHCTTIEETNNKFSYTLKTTYDKIATTVGEIRKNREFSTILGLWDKLKSKKIDKNIPVYITEKITNKIGEYGCVLPQYNVLIKGKNNLIRINGNETNGIATYKDKKEKITELLGLVNSGSPDEYKVLNQVINHFTKKYKDFQ